MRQSWLTPAAEPRPSARKGGLGVYAREPIAAGATVVAYGGSVIDRRELATLDEVAQHFSLQIDEALFLAGLPPLDPADYVNHSCDPNCGIVGSVLLVAMRDIAVDEEICFDYAMTDSESYDQFVCECGTAHCRGFVGGDDWKRPELRDRYEGWFSAYLARRFADHP